MSSLQEPRQIVHAEREYALIVRQTDGVPRVAQGYLRLILNYLYGLEIVSADKLVDAASKAKLLGPALRAVFLLQDEEITNRNAISSLGRRGELPVVVLMPPALAARHQALSRGMPNVRVCDWDQVIGSSESSLQGVVGQAFAAHGIVRLPVEAEGLSDDLLRARVVERLRHIKTLPALPELVLRIGRMLRDPETTAEDLETVLVNEPAIVHRLLQVIHSPAYAGTRESGRWSLKEAIVRLGLREVGAIAQQVKLINALVRPEDSGFDLRRFWEHSVGSACIADRLYRQAMIPVRADIPFDLYWVAALLHDIGQLVLGFLAWDYFEEVVRQMHARGRSFQRAEERLGHQITHEYLGRVLLEHSGAEPALVEAVGSHNAAGPHPGPLVCLVHVADCLCRALGLGYPEEPQATCSPAVLSTLGLSRNDLDRVRDTLGPDMAAQVRELVEECLHGPTDRDGPESPPAG